MATLMFSMWVNNTKYKVMDDANEIEIFGVLMLMIFCMGWDILVLMWVVGLLP